MRDISKWLCKVKLDPKWILTLKGFKTAKSLVEGRLVRLSVKDTLEIISATKDFQGFNEMMLMIQHLAGIF
jgi:hypothetical protein